MTEYLKQHPGGQIYVATEKLKQRSDMKPCDPPGTETKEPEPETQVDAESEPQSEEEGTEPESEDDESADTEKQRLYALYRQQYGRPAPPRMKIETLRERVKAEQ